MLRHPARIVEFEDKLIRETPVDVAANFRIFDAMVREARAVGALPPSDHLCLHPQLVAGSHRGEVPRRAAV